MRDSGTRRGRVVFVRHGESIWNCIPVRFTGWANVPLSDKGRVQAREVGNTLQMFGIRPDVVYTSLLRRSKESLDEIVKANEHHYNQIEIINSWRLNERHYGSLVGLSKDEAGREMGEEKVMRWRKSWDEAPPPMLKEDLYAYSEAPWTQPVTIVHSPGNKGTTTTHLEEGLSMPRAESLRDCCQRVLPLWREAIYPRILTGETILVVAHANSIRAVVKHVDADSISDDCVRAINIPSAIPLVYDFASTPHKGVMPTGKPNKYGMRGRYIASKALIVSLRQNLKNDHENDESLLASLDDSVTSALMTDPRASGGKQALMIGGAGAGVLREHYASTALSTPQHRLGKE